MSNSQNSLNKNQTMSTKRIVYCALFAALLSIAAYISLPLPLPGAPHITMINFVLFIISLLFAPLDSFLIVMVWLVLGIVGVPVFIGGKGGFAYLIQPWGAYTWAFPIVAIVLPLIRGKKYNRLWYTICGVIGVVIIDLVGMLYLMAMSHYSLAQGFSIGFLPFLPLDLVKAVVAAQIIPAFRRIIQ